MYAGRSNKPLAELKESNFSAGLVIQEIMQTKPGRQDDYIRELERLYVPWSERTGKRWLGSFITTFRFNEVIHYWALDGDWDCFANHYPSWKDSPPAEIVTWMSVAPALRDGWEDSICRPYHRLRCNERFGDAHDAELLLRSVRPGGDG